MATRQSNLNIKTVGMPVSAALSVPYALIMLASLLLVSLGTTRSWQAAILDSRPQDLLVRLGERPRLW